MATRLRTFLASWPWYLWLALGGIVVDMTIYAMIVLFPGTAAWPLRVRIVVYGLFWVGLLAIFVYLMRVTGTAVAQVLLMGALSRIEERTDKAKEKFADGLMSVSNTIHSATLLGLLVVPLTAFIQSIVSGKDPVVPLLDYLRAGGTGQTGTWHGVILGFLIFVPAGAASYMKSQALNLYDEIAERAALPPELRWRPKSLGNRSRK